MATTSQNGRAIGYQVFHQQDEYIRELAATYRVSNSAIVRAAINLLITQAASGVDVKSFIEEAKTPEGER